MTPILESDILTFPNAPAWELWMEEHLKGPGVWLRLAKKGAPAPTVTYDEALDSALCFGWIDGQKKSLDDFYFLQRFTPRRPQGMWSQRNVNKVAQLTAAGRIRPSGLAEIQAAQKDGRWEAAYSGSKDMVIPEEFLAALEKQPAAAEFFKTLNKANLFAIGFRLTTAKTPETKLRRLEKILGQLDRGEKLV